MTAQSTETIGHYYINESRKLEGEHQQYYELKGALRILNHKTDDATANHIIRKLASSKETHPSIKAEANLRNAYLKLRENDYNAAESIFRDLAEGIYPVREKDCSRCSVSICSNTAQSKRSGWRFGYIH